MKRTKKKLENEKKAEKKKQRTVAIDSSRRTSDPYVSVMDKWKGIKVWEVSLFQDSFSEVPIFSVCVLRRLSFTSISFV